MESVTHYQCDTTQCDIALREDARSKKASSTRVALVMDVLSGQIVGVDCRLSPLDQKTLKRVLRRLGTRRHPNNRRSS